MRTRGRLNYLTIRTCSFFSSNKCYSQKLVCHINFENDTHILLFGGKPLAHEPLLSWNFVSSDRQKLKQAKQDWQDHKFPKVPGDDTYIPFP